MGSSFEYTLTLGADPGYRDLFLRVVIGTAFVLMVAVGISIAEVVDRRYFRVPTGRCKRCGYDLRGLPRTGLAPGITCPECGRRDTNEATGDRIPSDRPAPHRGHRRRHREDLPGMTPTRKMEVLAGLYQSCRKIVEAAVRHGHPEWPDTRVNAEVLRRMRGPDWPGVAGEYHSP